MLVLPSSYANTVKLLDSNSCTAVVRNRGQVSNATLSNNLDVVAAYTHLNELVSNGLSTLLRKLLVELNATSLALSA